MPVLLDLFCGGGGAAMGYHRAGFTVVGVDQIRQPHYPFEFHRGDAMTWPLDGYDAVHASPPCKAHTLLRHTDTTLRLFDPHTDLLTPTLARLADLPVPWVVENVVGAPMPDDAVTYCGSSFGLLVRRHRLFASNVPLAAPPCDHAAQPDVLGVYGQGGGDVRANRPGGGGRKVSGAEAADALGVDWTTHQPALSQMIPPAYTEHIGRQLLAAR